MSFSKLRSFSPKLFVMVIQMSWPYQGGNYRRSLPRGRLTRFFNVFTMHGIFHGYSIAVIFSFLIYNAFIGQLTIEWE